MARIYKCLGRQNFGNGEFRLVPIREEDKYLIMRWRNDQIYHLRQDMPLTEPIQENYFNTVVNSLFDQDQPDQILFSYLQNEVCIGYGGLVHINWKDQHAEISFIMDTSLESNFFEFHWIQFLALLEKIAFDELKLYKIFTYAFDLRPRLYPILERTGFTKEARLKGHYRMGQNFIDVVIHAKLAS